MGYVYDILVNFQKQFYDFFEWEDNDEIIHIRKIPLFRITDKDFFILQNGSIVFGQPFLDEIYNLTERFKKVYVSNLGYACLFSNGKDAMALKLNKNGVVIGKSSLLLDEADDVARISEGLSLYDLKYKVLKLSLPSFKTRNEKKYEIILLKKIKTLYKNGDDNKLRFLYFECFNKEESDIKEIVIKLKKEIESCSKNLYKISEFFKLISSK